jgi:PAS domain S-box-containing protein
MTPDLLRANAVDDEHFERLRALDIGSGMVMPLTVRGTTIGALSLLRDSTKQPYTEADLKLAHEIADRAAVAVDHARAYQQAASQARAAQVLAHIDNGVFMIDDHNTVVVWNRAAEMILDVPQGAVIGRRLGDVIPAWDGIEAQVPITLLSSSGSVHMKTLPVETSDGREAWISISGVRFPGGTAYAFRDISDERQVERLKSDFVATVSHELRTPLASVYGAAMTLQREDIEHNSEIADQLVSIISTESQRLTNIISDVLMASRIDSGQLEIRSEPFDFVDVVSEVVVSTRARLETNAEIVPVFACETARIEGDPDRVRQVVINLVENAIKYSPEGGRIEVGVQQSDDERSIEFWVRDEGIGIPVSEHIHIFEKFYRLDPNQRRGVGGTGLGLYICRELVQRMGGRIVVESVEGRGSTFRVHLPSSQ